MLLSSGGRRVALVHALRDGAERAGVRLRIVVTDRSPLSAAGHLADRFHLVPDVRNPDFPAAMCDLIHRERVDVIVPTIDTELEVLATHRQLFEEAGAAVLVSSSTVIEICGDKERSSRWFREQGFPVPAQYQVEEVAELPPSAWPLFFKPKAGSSSIGAHAVTSMAEFELALVRYGPGVVEELVVGEEYTMDCWIGVEGDCLGVVPRLRLETRAGEISKGITVDHEELDGRVRQILAAMTGVRGPVTVQAMVGADGPRFIEVNPRFGGGYPLSHRAGAHFTAVLVAECAGITVDPAWCRWEPGVVMLRYDDAVFVRRSDLDAVAR